MNNINNLINGMQVNPLAFNNCDVSVMQMAKLDRRYPVILVDTSYWLYYRFFALRNWYNKAYPNLINISTTPTTTTKNSFNLEHNWLEDEIFIKKYKKLFIENIITGCKKHNTIINNVVFCIDCPHKNIWRLNDYPEYKGTRLESHAKNAFNSFNLFKYIRNEYLPELQILYGIKILYNNCCEADDIIGHFAPYLENNKFSKIIILANDNDYMQICNNNIIMNPNIIKTNNTNANTNPIVDGQKYLIKKILMGDISDNIKPCNIDIGFLDKGIPNEKYKTITNTIATKIIENIEKYNILKELLNVIRNGETLDNIKISSPHIKYIKQFYFNTKLIDFQMIPNTLKQELNNKFKNYV